MYELNTTNFYIFAITLGRLFLDIQYWSKLCVLCYTLRCCPRNGIFFLPISKNIFWRVYSQIFLSTFQVAILLRVIVNIPLKEIQAPRKCFFFILKYTSWEICFEILRKSYLWQLFLSTSKIGIYNKLINLKFWKR